MEITDYVHTMTITEIDSRLEYLKNLYETYKLCFSNGDLKTSAICHQLNEIKCDIEALLTHKRRMKLHEQYRRWITEKRS